METDRFPIFLTPILLLVAAVFLYVMFGALYRLYLSPLSRFPGPKLASVTFWYGCYYDVICQGQYVWKIEEMHRKHGPVVRINPDEIHIMDPDFYSVLYAGGKELRDKVFKHTRQFGMPDSMLFTVPQDLHRIRRAILSPFFSKASVYRLESLIQENVDKMVQRIEAFRHSRQSIPLFDMFAAYSNDVVMEYAFARSEKRLEKVDFDPVLLRALISGSERSHLLLHFNWIMTMLQWLPLSLAKLLDPGLGKVLGFQEKIKNQIRDIQSGVNRWDKKSSGSYRTIFHGVLNSDLPESEKRLERMWQEGMVVVGAGTDTTAWTLVVALVYIIENPEIRRTLENELKAAWAEKGQPRLSDLEKLPYLSACIKESLRLSYGLSARLRRVAPCQALEVPGTNGLVIPPGTKISMNSVLVHRNPRLFPEPDQFKPQRWLENPRLDRYLVSFSKGARQCIGINLAYAELYMGLAAVFNRFSCTEATEEPRLELLNGSASIKDVEIAGDMFLPSVKGDKGVKAIFR